MFRELKERIKQKFYGHILAKINNTDARLSYEKEQRIKEIELLRFQLEIAKHQAEILFSLLPLPQRHLTENTVRPLSKNFTAHEVLDKLKQEAPEAFKVWLELSEAGRASYKGNPPDSCSVQANLGAGKFAAFCEGKLAGTVLDIGCGTQATPLYLEKFPTDQIIGLDPLLPEEKHPFTFVQGYAEYLPFEDAVFDTVVAATSFDHTLIPQKALDEIYRVLKPFGHFIIWEAVHENSQRDFLNYNPYSAESFVPADKFHLFRFSKNSLFQFMTTKFYIHNYFIEGTSAMIDAIKTK